MKEKERKKMNLIIFNVEETEYTCRQERIDSELDICANIFANVQSEVKKEDIVETFRLGKYRKPEGRGEAEAVTTQDIATQNRRKPRPLLVKLKDERAKWEIIKNAQRIRYSRVEAFKALWIVPDLTMRERERDHELRRALQEKRDAGEEGWFIKKGRLHNRNFL